jgi:hypothetical protein
MLKISPKNTETGSILNGSLFRDRGPDEALRTRMTCPDPPADR